MGLKSRRVLLEIHVLCIVGIPTHIVGMYVPSSHLTYPSEENSFYVNLV